MTTTVNNNENKVTVNRIGFSGLFSKFFKEDTQVYDYLFEGGKCYSFAYYIGLNDDCKNGELFVQLSEPSNFSYRSDNRLSKVLSCLDGWNGEIYFTKEYSYCKLSFVSDNCDNCFMIDNKINYFNPIRDKNDSFPDKLTPVYCGKETKEPDTDTKPVRTPEIKNDTNLQESKESTANVTEISEKEKEFELLEADKEYFTGCSLGEVRACLNSKGLSVTIDKDNNIFLCLQRR